jgi:hypothetical protein
MSVPNLEPLNIGYTNDVNTDTNKIQRDVYQNGYCKQLTLKHVRKCTHSVTNAARSLLLPLDFQFMNSLF